MRTWSRARTRASTRGWTGSRARGRTGGRARGAEAPGAGRRAGRPEATALPVTSVAWWRVGGGLAATVLGASGLVAAAEAFLLLGPVGWPPRRWTAPAAGPAGGSPYAPAVLAVLAVGAVLTAVLAMGFGGARFARRHARALHDLGVDDLTGAGSRRAFAADLPRAVDEAGHAGRPLTLALVELGGVRTALDLLGRRRTEALVGAAAAALTTAPVAGQPARPAYRLAGELFAVVLPGVGPEAATAVAGRLVEVVGRRAFPLTASAGVRSLDARCHDASSLLVGASVALDEARASTAPAASGTSTTWAGEGAPTGEGGVPGRLAPRAGA